MDAMPPPLSALLDGLSDAETVEALSQDSASTLSPTPPLLAETPEEREKPECGNAVEEELRCRALHTPAGMPVLTWTPLTAYGKEGESVRAASSNESAASVKEDSGAVFLRWHLSLPGTSTTSSASAHSTVGHGWTSAWLPFTVAASELFPPHGRSTGHADTHTMSTAVSSGSLLDPMAHPRRTQRIGSAVLLLGRATLAECIRGSADAASTDSVRAALASLSRDHCTLHFHFTFEGASAPRCRSCDVFALTHASSLNGVSLQPHHRYRLQISDNRTAGGATCIMTLKLGPRCVVEVALAGVPDTAALQHPSTHALLPDSPGHLLPPKRSGGGDRRGAWALARASTASLFTADSTAVLATLSSVSEPVVLSDHDDDDDDDGVSSVHPPSFAAALVGNGAVSAQEAVIGSTSPQITKLPKRRTAAAAAAPTPAAAKRPPRRRKDATAALAVRDAGAAQTRGEVEEVAVAAAPALAPNTTVIFTTGLRLSDDDEAALKGLGALVNPHLRYAPHATLLVAQRPLMRSVKLLTVLPFVRDIVQEGWLRTVLHTRSLDIAIHGFSYSERKLVDGIESVNCFDLRETMQKSAAERQRLFSNHRFWVHKAAAPQEPPLNDLKTVLTASGGALTKRVSEATVLVMPQQRPPVKVWKPLLEETEGVEALAQRRQSGLLLVTPDDVFRCVLQQRPLLHSTVTIPRKQLSDEEAGGGVRANHTGSRQSTEQRRKTQRAASSQRSQRPSTRRRST